MKKCICCNIEKDISEFYFHDGMSDKHLNKCKECCKTQSKIRDKLLRLNNDWVLKEKERSIEKYHRLNYKEKQKQYTNKSPWKNTSDYKGLHRKLKTLSLIDCFETAHHWNYNYLLDVFIINKEFHRFIHTLIKPCGLIFIEIKTGEKLDTVEKHHKFLTDSLIEFNSIIKIKRISL